MYDMEYKFQTMLVSHDFLYKNGAEQTQPLFFKIRNASFHSVYLPFELTLNPNRKINNCCYWYLAAL